MRGRNELWQECGYWQNRFIHHNILVLGHTAWIGYLNEGRGVVACHIADRILPDVDWAVDQICFNRAFVPQGLTAGYLQMLKLEETAIAVVLSAVATYDPTQAIVVLIIGNDQIDINLLQGLAISPIGCYQQVQRRWSEFQPNLTTERSSL